jgi:NADPH:quinone reductase-like Zn-dependent oxidoreductase
MGDRSLTIEGSRQTYPKDNDVLIKVHASTVHAGDVRMRKFDVPPAEWLFAKLF